MTVQIVRRDEENGKRIKLYKDNGTETAPCIDFVTITI